MHRTERGVALANADPRQVLDENDVGQYIGRQTEQQDMSAMQFEPNSQESSKPNPTHSSGGQESHSNENVDPRFLADAEKSRADTYRVLARLFREAPDAELLQILSDCCTRDVSGSDLTGAWSDLAEASRGAEPGSLDREFHALFIGLGRGEVLPYGSWYLSGFLLDKPLARLRSDLNELGIERADDVSESEDHFAAVCETMALLVDTEAGIDHAGQKIFFERHLQPWVSQFFDDVHAARNANYYRHVATLAQRFFEFEKSWLSLPQ